MTIVCIVLIVIAELTGFSPLVILLNDYRRIPSYGVDLAARIVLICGSAICVGATIVLSFKLLCW